MAYSGEAEEPLREEVVITVGDKAKEVYKKRQERLGHTSHHVELSTAEMATATAQTLAAFGCDVTIVQEKMIYGVAVLMASAFQPPPLIAKEEEEEDPSPPRMAGA